MVDSLHWSPHYASHFKVILECVLKKNLSFFFIYIFAFLCPVIGLEKSRHALSQSDENLKSPLNWTLNSLHMKLVNCFCVEILFVRGVQRQLSSFCPRLKALNCWERYLQDWLDFKCISTFFFSSFSQLICSDTIVNYISGNFVVWAWDMTHDTNRTRWVYKTESFQKTCLNFCHKRATKRKSGFPL